MKNQNPTPRHNHPSSDGSVPQEEPYTFQSKGSGFESRQLHQIHGSFEDLPLRDLLMALFGPEG